MNNFTIARKIILDKRRPFTGHRVSDAGGGFFSVPLERLAGSMPFRGLLKSPALPGGLTFEHAFPYACQPLHKSAQRLPGQSCASSSGERRTALLALPAAG